jgi:hypothetical protein
MSADAISSPSVLSPVSSWQGEKSASAPVDTLSELWLSLVMTLLNLCGLDRDREDCEKRLRREKTVLGRWGCDCDACSMEGPEG